MNLNQSVWNSTPPQVGCEGGGGARWRAPSDVQKQHSDALGCYCSAFQVIRMLPLWSGGAVMRDSKRDFLADASNWTKSDSPQSVSRLLLLHSDTERSNPRRFRRGPFRNSRRRRWAIYIRVCEQLNVVYDHDYVPEHELESICVKFDTTTSRLQRWRRCNMTGIVWRPKTAW
jgi:hypothetical protein